jgi:hypothetical protein
MSAPGLVWLPGGEVLSPEWLYSICANTLGADFQGLYLGQDMTYDETGKVLSLPGRGGATLANSSGSLKFDRSIAYGRPAIVTATLAQAKSLVLNDALVTKCILILAEGKAASAAYECAGFNYANTAIMFARDNLTTNWYTAQATHFCDGVATEAIPTSGLHVFEADVPGNATGGIEMFGARSANPAWGAPVLAFVRVANVLSSGNRTIITNALKRYGRVP